MNFQTTEFLPPLRVMIINPLLPASQLLITKILSGIVFGKNQVIDLILLVYANEIHQASDLKLELTGCAFPCFNSIKVTSDLPRITDADVFCIMTTFVNPNSFDFENMDSTDQFDNIYLIIKMAASLLKPVTVEEPRASPTKKETGPKKKEIEPEKPTWRPIIVADGLLVLDILMIIAKTLPPDILFATTPLRSIAKIVLGDYLKVKCTDINQSYVWAANDQVFHTEIERPYLKADIIDLKTRCDWNAISPQKLEELHLEHINFNESWMKIEFIERMVLSASTNPYGCIFKAAEMSHTLAAIWKPRDKEIGDVVKSHIVISLGIISDGSLGTKKGLPYVLPLVINENSYTVSEVYEETSHVRHEIKRINKEAVAHHEQLVPYCKKFLEENVIKKAFIPVCLDSESEDSENSTYTLESSSDD